MQLPCGYSGTDTRREKRKNMRRVPVLDGLGLFPAAHSTSDEMMFKCEPRCAGYNKPGRRQQRSSHLAIWGGGLDPRSAAYYASSRIQCLFSCLVLLLSFVRHSASAPTAWGRTPELGPCLAKLGSSSDVAQRLSPTSMRRL